MSGHAGTIPLPSESWNLRPDSVNNSSICNISENENWRTRMDDDHRTANKDLGNFPGGILLKTNSDNVETKPEATLLQEQNRKQAQGSVDADVVVADANSKRKRHASASYVGGNHRQVGRKRRKTTDRNPSHPKFLMGGNMKDPLNLNSLCNEEVSRFLNAVTPISSPLPHLNKDPNPVIVPVDVTDPLKLNTVCGETDDTANLTRTLTPKATGKKRKKRTDKPSESHSADEATILTKPANLNLEGIAKPPHHASASKIPDKIVSPVLPECGQTYRKRKKMEPTTKIARALLVDEADSKTTEGSPEKKTHPHPHTKERTTPEKRKYKRQTSKESKPLPPKFKDQNKKFQYGNYHRYYGYRNPDQEDDPRIPFLRKEWFGGKTCLDIGCNSGHVTLYIAKNFVPERITGIDIDGTLIGIARKNIRHCVMEDMNEQQKKFPTSMEKIYGPLTSTAPATKQSYPASKFPSNILFRCANFVPENDNIVELQKPEYDTILCLSVTKWIHLNWGDAGLKRMFRRIFLSLRPGGRFILEPQDWPSYNKKKKLTETTYKNFKQIQLKPNKFKDYLLSSRIGFSSCETIGTPLNKSKGFRRPMFMFTKLTTSRSVASKPRATVTSDQLLLMSSRRPESSETAEVRAPSTVQATSTASHRQSDEIPRKSAVEAAPPKKEIDDEVSRKVQADRPGCVQPSPKDIHQEDLDSTGNIAKTIVSEDAAVHEIQSKPDGETPCVDAQDASQAQDADRCRSKDTESPPSKKLKTEPAD